MSLSTCLEALKDVSLLKSQIIKFVIAVSLIMLLYFCAELVKQSEKNIIVRNGFIKNCLQRTGLCAGRALLIVQPGTKAQ